MEETQDGKGHFFVWLINGYSSLSYQVDIKKLIFDFLIYLLVVSSFSKIIKFSLHKYIKISITILSSLILVSIVIFALIFEVYYEEIVCDIIISSISVGFQKFSKEIIEEETHWYTFIEEWWQGDRTYDGSGWGHGARQSFAKAIGLDDGEVNSLFEAGIYSMLQAGDVDISNSQRLIKKINEDSAFIAYEKEIASLVINSPDYLNKNFEISELPLKSIQLGGKRAKGGMWDQFKNPFSKKYRDTWKVAANELTWLLRSIGVKSKVVVNKNGNVIINHKFKDIFDLRPSDNGSRSFEYDVVSIITGFLYHDIAGGNDLMEIKGNWNNSYSKKDIEWKANGDKIIEEGMKKWKEKMDEDRLKWIRETR